MIIFKIATLFIMFINAMGWSSDSDPFASRSSGYNPYLTNPSQPPYQGKRKTFKQWVLEKGKLGNLGETSADGMLIIHSLENIDDIINWYETANEDQITVQNRLIRRAFALEQVYQPCSAANMNYAFIYRYITTSSQPSKYMKILNEYNGCVPQCINSGLLKKRTERKKTLAHDIPIYMENYGFREYWREVGKEIDEQKLKKKLSDIGHRQQKAAEMGEAAKT
ncbi:MAG: hypothetical protein LBF65_01080 [Holosporales bacterium]|jgi:hypothetical protein|nr:hypothetical protein [Holosporales bacterium]